MSDFFQGDGKVNPMESTPKKSGFWFGLIALCIKFGPKLLSVIAKLAKSAKVIKVGLAGSTLIAYAYIFTWHFAFLLVGSLFIHELGHIIAMKQCGIKTKGIYFIPFVGGAAIGEFDRTKMTRWDEVYIAMMGPIFGLFTASALAGVYIFTDNPFWAASAAWVASVNLFNLLPINPLDGGRVIKSVAFSLHNWIGLMVMVLGLLGAALYLFNIGIGIFAFLFVVATLEIITECLGSKQPVTMGWMGILLSLTWYALTIICLWMIITGMSHVPDAGLARQLFEDVPNEPVVSE